MGFQWDSAKSVANEAKHGVSFLQAAQIFKSPVLKTQDARRDYGETRFIALGTFDGESSTITPFGFLSMGDTGSIDFDLSSAVSTAGLFLYIGEVGDNGEVAAGAIVVREGRTVTEPGSLALALLGLTGAALGLRCRPPSPRG